MAELTDAKKKAIDILADNSDLFHSVGTWDYMIHFFKDILFVITLGLYKLVTALENVLNQIVTFGGLLDGQEITQLSSRMTPIAFILMALVIGVLGLSIIMGKKLPISKLVLNIVLASLFIMTIPNLFSIAFDVNQSLIKDTNDSSFVSEANKLEMTHKKDLTSLSSQVMAMNITDLYWFAKNNYKKSPDGINNNLTDESFIVGNVGWGEKIKPAKDESKEEILKEGFRYFPEVSKENSINAEVFSNRIVKSDSGGYRGYELMPLSDGIGKSFFGSSAEAYSGYYKRYQVNFFSIWITLCTLGFVYLFTAFRVVRLGFEIATQKIIAPWIAVTDLSTLQKVKQLIISILTNYGLIWLILVFLKVFIILSSLTFKSDLPFPVQLIIFIGLAFGTVDGSDEVKKILGVDAGIKSGYQTYMGALAGGAVAGKVLNNRMTRLAGRKAGGMIKDKWNDSGIKGKLNERKQRKEALKVSEKEGKANESNNADGGGNQPDNTSTNPSSSRGENNSFNNTPSNTSSGAVEGHEENEQSNESSTTSDAINESGSSNNAGSSSSEDLNQNGKSNNQYSSSNGEEELNNFDELNTSNENQEYTSPVNTDGGGSSLDIKNESEKLNKADISTSDAKDLGNIVENKQDNTETSKTNEGSSLPASTTEKYKTITTSTDTSNVEASNEANKQSNAPVQNKSNKQKQSEYKRINRYNSRYAKTQRRLRQYKLKQIKNRL
ncbi:pLS20_p028 family conjugation system transmembrane protein [Staphylococcus pseudintermedius]